MLGWIAADESGRMLNVLYRSNTQDVSLVKEFGELRFQPEDAIRLAYSRGNNAGEMAKPPCKYAYFSGLACGAAADFDEVAAIGPYAMSRFRPFSCSMRNNIGGYYSLCSGCFHGQSHAVELLRLWRENPKLYEAIARAEGPLPEPATVVIPNDSVSCAN